MLPRFGLDLVSNKNRILPWAQASIMVRTLLHPVLPIDATEYLMVAIGIRGSRHRSNTWENVYV